MKNNNSYMGIATRHHWYKKKNHHNFIMVVIFVIYYKGMKKMDNGYLNRLTFTLFKFTLKNFLFLKMVSDSMVSQHFLSYIYKKKKCKILVFHYMS